MIHGRYTTYNNHGCRCDECTAAKAAYNVEAGKRRRKTDPDDTKGLRRDALTIIPVQPDGDEWRAEAACRGVDPKLFFPHSRSGRKPRHGGPTGPEIDDLNEARRICIGCPVNRECLGDALSQRERYGVRGGHTSTERRPLARKWSLFYCNRCGDVARERSERGGYSIHCDDCKRAARAESVERYRLEHSDTDPWWSYDDQAELMRRIGHSFPNVERDTA